MPPLQSEARTLRQETERKAKASFAFFARSVLGFRKISRERLTALAQGQGTPTEKEASLLRKWLAFREGVVLPETVWFASRGQAA